MSGSDTSRYDVVVCGAGVAGLATARAMSELGLRVLVVDKQHRPRPVAKGEVLQPGALRVLRRWGTARALERRNAVRLGRLVVRGPAGEALMALDYGRLPEGDRSLVAHDHLTILDALSEDLGPRVELRRGVLVEEALRDSAGRVIGVLLAQENRRSTVHADLVVAADGIASRLRRAAGIDGRRLDYPHRLLSFEITGAAWRPEDFSAYLTARGLRLAYPLPGGRVRLYAQVTPEELRGLDSAQLAAWASEMLRGTPALEPLAGPLRESLPTRQILPVFRLLTPRLSVPGLALVGESAYAVHPMAAQGMNTAITSADCLSGLLAEHLDRSGALSPGVVDGALRDYERRQVPALAHTARTSDNAARMVTDLSWRGRLLGRRAVRHTGANPRLLRAVTYNMAGLGPVRLTPLDRLHQIGLLPDPRAHRVPDA